MCIRDRYMGMCPIYELVAIPHKVEILRHVLENTKGEDLQRVLWLKSPSSEVWLEKRTNYCRSLATMSMVGYILGLGDRHPSNLMMQRMTGKIVHIDFGDCFEVAMKRDKFPEKVPFRLTRMLIKALEASGIEGNFHDTCRLVMDVLRQNKESVYAILEAFAYDPLINWRLLTPSDSAAAQAPANGDLMASKIKRMDTKEMIMEGLSMGAIDAMGGVAGLKVSHQTSFRSIAQGLMIEADKALDQLKTRSDNRMREVPAALRDNEGQRQPERLNQKALEVIDRIKKKLVGRDFVETESLSVENQVDRLIKQATSIENISQAYIGWCPYW
eukprot:TRINITY_DN12727_c0_g5_i2.p1 TRINITY_DN12727_c0_g5~~TRINITY_DN12727_c0_g5_i2.p1  ORF type:complete len:329 (-),score=90.43 TRINITY_DN12727_c0_g5_i2:44-1030(-)